MIIRSLFLGQLHIYKYIEKKILDKMKTANQFKK